MSLFRTPGFRLLVALGTIIIGCTLAMSGCAKPRVSEPSALVRQPNLNLAAQGQLFEEAREHLKGGRPHAAIRLLTNLVQRHPHSPLLPDMRYLLGRAYEQTGNVVAAEESYRALIRDTRTDDPKNRRLLMHARRRLSALAPELERAGPRIFNGLLVTVEDVPAESERGIWLSTLRQAGISDLVLEIGTPAGQGSASRPGSRSPAEATPNDPPPLGVYFRTSWAPVVEDLFEQIIPLARERGIGVYGAVSLRRMPWLEPEEGWTDVRYDPESGQLERSQALDLFHPGFQHYLEGLMVDLVDSGVEGIVFRGDAPLGPRDGFSAFAMSRFERAFGSRLDPVALLKAEDAESPGLKGPAYPSEFWRWVGWRTRESLALMGRLATAMRHHRGDLQVGVELHAAAIVDPTRALVQYGEDIVETKRAGFDFLLLMTSGAGGDPDGPTALPTSLAIGAPDDRPLTLLGRAVDVMGDARHVWLTQRLPEGSEPVTSVSQKLSTARAQLPEPVGLLYVPAHLTVP